MQASVCSADHRSCHTGSAAARRPGKTPRGARSENATRTANCSLLAGLQMSVASIPFRATPARAQLGRKVARIGIVRRPGQNHAADRDDDVAMISVGEPSDDRETAGSSTKTSRLTREMRRRSWWGSRQYSRSSCQEKSLRQQCFYARRSHQPDLVTAGRECFGSAGHPKGEVSHRSTAAISLPPWSGL